MTPADSSFLIGETKQFTAMATLSDGSVVDASASVAWSSGNSAIATINGDGLATGIAGGATTIAATMQDSSGVSATTQLTVYYPLPAYGTGCVIGILVDSFGAEWTCPPLQSEVDAAGIPYDGTIKHNGKTYVTMTWPNGNNYCTYLGQGFRLPTLAEYQGLFAEFGDLSIAAGWPTSSYHWTGDYSSGSNHYAFSTMYGGHSSIPDAYYHFVSCRRAAE